MATVLNSLIYRSFKLNRIYCTDPLVVILWWPVLHRDQTDLGMGARGSSSAVVPRPQLARSSCWGMRMPGWAKCANCWARVKGGTAPCRKGPCSFHWPRRTGCCCCGWGASVSMPEQLCPSENNMHVSDWVWICAFATGTKHISLFIFIKKKS